MTAMTHHPDEKVGLTQREEVWAYMLEHGEITTLDAIVDLGITRLAARISELRADPEIQETHSIPDEWIEVPRRRGKGTTRVKRYWAEQKAPAYAPIRTDQQIGLLGGVA